MLQRLAGKETVDNLNVAVYDLSTINIDPNDIDFSKKRNQSKNTMRKNQVNFNNIRINYPE